VSKSSLPLDEPPSIASKFDFPPLLYTYIRNTYKIIQTVASACAANGFFPQHFSANSFFLFLIQDVKVASTVLDAADSLINTRYLLTGANTFFATLSARRRVEHLSINYAGHTMGSGQCPVFPTASSLFTIVSYNI